MRKFKGREGFEEETAGMMDVVATVLARLPEEVQDSLVVLRAVGQTSLQIVGSAICSPTKASRRGSRLEETRRSCWRST